MPPEDTAGDPDRSDEMFRRLIENGIGTLVRARLCGFASFTPGLGDLLKSATDQELPLRGPYGAREVP